MKNILREFFIYNSTLGMLNGESGFGNEASIKWKGKDFKEFSTLRKFFSFVFVSTIRFVVDFFTFMLPASILVSLVKAIIFTVEVDDYKTIEILEPYNSVFGDYLSFWGLFFMGFFGWLLIFSVLYILFRNFVNLISFAYYAFKS